MGLQATTRPNIQFYKTAKQYNKIPDFLSGLLALLAQINHHSNLA